MSRNFRYCVLYIHDAEQQKLKDLIEQHLPKEHGEVFIPKVQMYRRGDKQVNDIAIFSGYVFLYTDLNIREVHEILNECRTRLKSLPKELALKERCMSEPEFLYERSEDDRLYELSDLNEEETLFFDTLRAGRGLLTMSSGYMEDKKYHVMEGPLKFFEDKIEKVDKHNRKAFLRFEINGRQARVGFECKPKTYWFPKEDTRMAKLADGTEVDLGELGRKVMTITK